MKVFLDSNVLISAFISDGNCKKIFIHCMDNHFLFISEQVKVEFIRFLAKKMKFNVTDSNKALSTMIKIAHVVPDGKLDKPVCRDKNDDPILASALDAKVDCIISGDKDLFVLKKIKKIPIVNPSDFWKFEDNFKK